MILAPKITFRNMEPAPQLEEAVLKEATWLERFFPRIVSCRVAIEGPKRGERNPYRIRIDLGVPGEKLVVDQAPTLHATLKARETAHKTKKSEPNRQRRDPQLAVREAFQAMRRRLQDYVRRMSGETKQHEESPAARVIRLSPKEDFGILDSNGREIYFHRNSVLGNNFSRLRIGSQVRFNEEMGEKGPKATTVRLIRPERTRKAAMTKAPARAL